MSNEHNIDKLLKESFEHFSPEAPNVWQAVQQGVQAAQTTSAVSSGAVSATVKGVSLAVKVVSGIILSASVIGGYVWYHHVPNDLSVPVATKKVEVTTQAAPEHIHQLDENTQGGPITPTLSAPIHKSSSDADRPIAKKPSNKKVEQTVSTKIIKPSTNHLETIPEGSKGSKPETDSKGIVLKQNPQKKEQPVIVQTNPVKQADQPDISAKSNETVATKEKEKPYNPYLEEGELYEKPIIPGSFSPNNDGINDVFEIVIENETVFNLRILNSTEELVFESKNKNQVWDGRHYKTGIPCSAGNYLYQLNYQYKGSDKVHEKSGLIGMFY
jgi:gliding motility-associated-like protein